MNLNLHVMMAIRNRTYMTEKTILSLQSGKSIFNNIYIYLFDNYSELTFDRHKCISNLITNNLVHYYSYDTSTSLVNCFGKSQAHYRFYYMMKARQVIQSKKSSDKEISKLENTDYYAICDNDLLFGRDWAQYFVSAANYADSKLPDSYYILRYKWANEINNHTANNINLLKSEFSDNDYKLLASPSGGGSAFWFMTHNMFNKCTTEAEDLVNVYKFNKKHDSTIWRKIRSQNKDKPNINYSCQIKKVNEEEDPMILHLGVRGLFNSICGADPKYAKKQEVESEHYDNKIKNMTVEEMFEKFKQHKHLVNW